MRDSSAGSITKWIGSLKQGDDEAASRLWDRYFERLCRLARQRLGETPRRVADEEDIALSVFEILYRGVAEDRFPRLTDRDDLWRLLVAVTVQKVIDQKRHGGRQKRGGARVRGESVFFHPADPEFTAGFQQVVAEEPTPEFVAMMNEEHERLLHRLRDDTLRRIACWRMEGYSNAEIAEKLGTSVRTVERKLNLIRESLSKEIVG